MPPAFSFLFEKLHPPTSRLPALVAAFAHVALAKRQQIMVNIAQNSRHCFETLIAALERVAPRQFFAIPKLVYVLSKDGGTVECVIVGRCRSLLSPIMRQVSDLIRHFETN